ncbi:MAG: RHS repeat-associated core domain-containing protein, partial [Bacteroidia bacterium]|nr:RHS repeat-associated core domain-containing protein [Bacteroidia bacterium]
MNFYSFRANTTYDYLSFGTWYQSKMKTMKITKKRDTETVNYIRSIEYINNPLTGLLTNIIIDPDKPKSVTTTYDNYDAFGNARTISVSGSDFEARSTLLEYDAGGRFVTKQTNPLGQISQAQYDPKFGVVTWAKDINGLITINKYDGFGRFTEKILPTGLTVTTTMSLETNPVCESCPPYYSISTTTGNLPSFKEIYDNQGRKVREETTGFNGSKILSEWEYNQKNQLTKYIQPHFEEEDGIYTEYKYLNNGRIEKEKPFNGEVDIDYSYSTYIACTTTVTKYIPASGLYISTSKAYDAFGNLYYVSNYGSTARYYYYSSGLIKEINSEGVSISMTYDEYGRQDLLNDPSAGTIDYDYNSLGELVRQSSPSGIYEMTYDKLGRLKTKTLTSTGEKTTYMYDTEANGKGMPASVSLTGGITKSFKYDSYSLVSQITETIDGQPYTTKYTYDAYGRPTHIDYPSESMPGFGIDRHYNENGYLDEVRQTGAAGYIWHAGAMTALNQPQQYTCGNSLQTTKNYDPYGFLSNISTGNEQNVEYKFDIYTGNLEYRHDLKYDFKEIFNYVPYERLTWVNNEKLPGSNDFAYSYDIKGNLSCKSYFGTTNFSLGGIYYGENGASPYAATSTDNSAGIISDELQTTNYTSSNKIDNITEGDYMMQFTYSPNNERCKTELSLKDENNIYHSQSTKYYSGNYEKEINQADIRELYYIFAGDGLAAVYITNDLGSKMYYILKDHLGSIVGITDESGNLLEELSYDTWGNRRNPADGSYTNIPVYNILSRGFTGHEHLDQFGLINMNARLYDPVLSRFLSPDNYVPIPDYTQSLNRYSYALNNPLKYTDPDGEFPWVAVGIGAAFGGFTGYMIADARGYDFRDEQMYWYILGG